MHASRTAVKVHKGCSPIGSSLGTGFQFYLSKCRDPFVSLACMIRLVFLWGVSYLFQHVDLVTTSHRARFQVCLP